MGNGTSRKRAAVLATVLLVGGVAWTTRHALSFAEGSQTALSFVWVATTGALVWMLGTAWLERPYTATAEERAELDNDIVVVNVPVFNEAPEIVHEVLRSLLAQTRLPNFVEVVDDGSDVDYASVESWWLSESKKSGVCGTWKRTLNQGKRHAQLETFRRCDWVK